MRFFVRDGTCDMLNYSGLASILFLQTCILSPQLLLAQESALQTRPIQGDAKDLEIPFEHVFLNEEKSNEGPFGLREGLKHLSPFLRDMSAKINLRNYYFARQNAQDSHNNDDEQIAWAQGGSLQVKSGKLLDVFSVNFEEFTSQRLYGPVDKDGTLLLETNQEGYSVLGIANIRLENDGHLLSLYRQRVDLPYVNSQDNRMTPNTFEAYSYGFDGTNRALPLQLGVGYFDQIKVRNSEDFVPMSQAAGVQDSDRGMPWAGLRFRPNEDVKFSAVNYTGIEFLNISYADLDYGKRLSDKWSVKSSAQVSTQNYIGDDLSSEQSSTSMYGIQQALSYGNFMLRTAITINDKSKEMISPFGTYPGYNCSIVREFNRAGEIAWKVGISYDFTGIGLDGLTAYSDYIQGNRAMSDDKNPVPDENEIDVNIDYRIREGILNGFWLRLRSGVVHDEGVGTTTDFRIIANYEIPII